MCLDVIASEAKQSILSFLVLYGLLRFARNDGAGDGLLRGACHRSRQRRDPVAEYDGLCEAAPIFGSFKI